MTKVQKAFDGLRRMISSGALAPGDRLPSEAELCEELDVSRSSLREAQKMLGFAGVLSSRTGSGSYVSPLTAEHVMAGLGVTIPLIPLEGYLELFDLRRILEGYAAGQAAATFDDDQRARLVDLADRLAARDWGDDGSSLDDAFHELLVSGAQSASISALLKAMRTRGGHYRVFEREDALDLKAGSDEAHRRIARAVADGDPDLARMEAMHHIATTRTWLEGLRPSPEP